MTVKILILFVILSFCYGSIFVVEAQQQHFKQRNLKKVKPQPMDSSLLDYDYEDYNYINDLPDSQTIVDRGMRFFFLPIFEN